MTTPDPVTADEPVTLETPVIADAWPELHALACAHRRDWQPVEWLGMIRACRDAGLPYKDVYVEVLRLNWDLKTSHPDALAEVRNLGRKLAQRPPRKGSPDPGVMAALRAGDYAAAWAATHDGPVPSQITRVTGGQPVLTPENDPRAGTMPATETARGGE